MAVPIIVGVVMIVASFNDCYFETRGLTDELICPDGAPSAGLLGGGIAVTLLGVLFVIVIYVRALGRTGQTWGRRIVGNKVVRVDSVTCPASAVRSDASSSPRSFLPTSCISATCG
jgi:hypothetical protein